MKEKDANALLVHIQHSKPVEISEFTNSLNAVGNLYSSYMKKHGLTKEATNAKLYVSKIEEGSIDVILQDLVLGTMIPFFENANTMIEFATFVKGAISYFAKGQGEKPDLSIQDCKDLKEVMTITAGDKNGTMEIGAINSADKSLVFVGCAFNFTESNSAQNQLAKEIEALRVIAPADNTYTRQLMKIYQMRSDMSNDKGNKAIIDSIAPKKKVGVVFETDDLKERILNSDENPAKKAYLVDVVVQTIDGKLAAYKVTSLHDVIDLEEEN